MIPDRPSQAIDPFSDMSLQVIYYGWRPHNA